MEIVLSAYFQPTESAAIRAGQLSWWCDELQDWDREQVVWGLRRWNADQPRKRPTPGDIVAILKAERGRQKAAEVAALTAKAEPAREPVSPEAAAEILARAGFRPKPMNPEDDAA